MGKMTPAQAKNAIRRALTGILDPYPSVSEIDRLWDFFQSSCTYCGRLLVRQDRQAHVDHLVSTHAGGTNDLGNFVLSCGVCNGDEKREENWESFLRKKTPDKATYAVRRERISNWISICPQSLTLDPSIRKTMNEEIDRAVTAFDHALQNIRRLKDGRAGL